jgi:hypothetical protein
MTLSPPESMADAYELVKNLENGNELYLYPSEAAA